MFLFFVYSIVIGYIWSRVYILYINATSCIFFLLQIAFREGSGVVSSNLVFTWRPIIISRKFGSAIWSLDKVLEYLNDELRAQENCASNFERNSNSKLKGNDTFTTSGLVVQTSMNMCVYCKKQHPSSKCRTVTNVASRNEILRKEGRCFLCLEEGHSVRDCKSKYICRKCTTGKHHISICDKKEETLSAFSFEEGVNDVSLASNENSSILMQTAKARIFNTNSDNVCLSRMLFDTGSQRSYISMNVRKRLKLKKVRTERVVIKTFGESNNSKVSNLDVVQFKVRHVGVDDVFTYVEALCVPQICSPLKG